MAIPYSTIIPVHSFSTSIQQHAHRHQSDSIPSNPPYSGPISIFPSPLSTHPIEFAIFSGKSSSLYYSCLCPMMFFLPIQFSCVIIIYLFFVFLLLWPMPKSSWHQFNHRALNFLLTIMWYSIFGDQSKKTGLKTISLWSFLTDHIQIKRNSFFFVVFLKNICPLIISSLANPLWVYLIDKLQKAMSIRSSI